MQTEVIIPSVGESVTEATLAQWYKKNGDLVRKDEPLFVVETDKVTLEIEAEADGILNIAVPEGETVAIGAVVGTLDTEVVPEVAEKPSPRELPEAEPAVSSRPPGPPPAEPAAAIPEETISQPVLAPSVRRLVAERNLDISQIAGSGPGDRITKGDVMLFLEQTSTAEQAAPQVAHEPATPHPTVTPIVTTPAAEEITRKPMSRIRQRIASRLLEAKQNSAMLTTFNEIDMSGLMGMRSRFRDAFLERYGVKLGIMSFFIKACVEALRKFPEINASIDGKDVVYHNYYHIGVAIGAERGLVVPVIRHADRLGFADLEQAIVDYVRKIRENRLELADLEGGTFTITNGGVFGSLLSTPILNMPQSGILGMHTIQQRPVVHDGQVVVRPMMYVALTYDHRMVDGRQAVTFLVRIKELIQEPERIMMEI